MTEFTGERVIPGAVNDELWAEHIARYAFAARYGTGGAILDLGCGAGYGLAELAGEADKAIGIDVAPEAIAHARASYPMCQFLQGSVTALPFRDRSFRLITAFEVIEHIADWPALISEARRTLDPDGLFLVSTPNRLYYTESRGTEGPNPFHIHEFTYDEFHEALQAAFPRVTVLQQNRTEAFAFSPARPTIVPVDARIDGSGGTPDQAHFFVAICGINAAPQTRAFVYFPRVSNLLREREQHIELLQQQLKSTQNTLAAVQADHANLVQLHEQQTQQLEEHNRWALKVESDWRAALDRIAQLQDELKNEQSAAQHMASAYAAKVVELEQENEAKTRWALETDERLSAELSAKCAELTEAVRLLDQAETTVAERTVWAQQLQKQVEHLETQISMIRQSRWIRVGRAVGVGPRVQD